MSCPTIDFGIPSGGATEYSVNTGRELFQCGTSCVKMYLTNVSVETTTVTMSCGDISDAGQGEYCLQSGNVSARDQNQVNWMAKEGASTSLPNGSVITYAGTCEGGSSIIYTHTEGQLSGRVIANISSVMSNKDAIKDAILSKINSVGGNTAFSSLDWIFSDVSINASPTDWQGGSVTFQGFGTLGGGSSVLGGSFNWQNGQSESRDGSISYDQDSGDTAIAGIISSLMG